MLGKQATFGVPSFVFTNGLALGGGVEIGLNADYRTIDRSTAAFALPEVFLGLIPGWGGAYILPNLIGIENALKVVVENPLKQNRMLKPQEVFDLGIADAIFDSANFLEDSLQWADKVLSGTVRSSARTCPARSSAWSSGMPPSASPARCWRAASAPSRSSPYVALDLLKAAKSGTKEEGFEREDDALAELISGDQFQASIYAFNLVQKRAKRPAGAPDKKLAKKVTKIGVIGAGYMASQFALLFVRRLRVPVVITDLDQAHVDKGVAYIHDEIGTLLEKGRISPDEANRLRALVTGTTDKSAVRRLRLGDRGRLRGTLREAGRLRRDRAVRLRRGRAGDEHVVALGGADRRQAEAPGAAGRLPLLHPGRRDAAHRGRQHAEHRRGDAVHGDGDRRRSEEERCHHGGHPRLRRQPRAGQGARARRCTPSTTARPSRRSTTAFAPLGLPMPPSALLDLVGLKVGAHVLDTHHAAFPDRFYRSENLHRLAEYGTLLEKDGKGKIKGIDKGAAKIVSGGKNPVDEGARSCAGWRTGWPTRSTGCSRTTTSSPRRRTSTSA